MKVLGINDDVTTCECCGKTNLKKTVVLATETGEVHYGVNCAARALLPKVKGAAKSIETQATAMALANKWLAAGHTPEVVRQGIWNRFGYPCGIQDGHLIIGIRGEVGSIKV